MRPVLALLIFLASLNASACPPDCKTWWIGTWKSDVAESMSYNREHAQLEARQDEFLATLMGKMTVSVDEDQAHASMPDTLVSVNGKQVPFEGFDYTSAYEILFCNSRMIVVRSTDIAGDEDVTTYYIVDDDLMWTYIGGNKQDVPDLHAREYFRRVDAGAVEGNSNGDRGDR